MPAIYHEGSWLGNATDPEVLVKDTVGWTGKNLLVQRCIYNNYATYGITWNTNADGSITANGTATNASVIDLIGYSNPLNLPTGEYILSGGINQNQYIYVNGCKNGAYVNTFAEAKETDAKFAYPSTYDVDGFKVSIRINSGQTVNNLTFYPMIRKADITDPTYEPYHESVEEEIEQIYADNGVLGAKNLLKNEMVTHTSSGITFTVNADKSITINAPNTQTGTSGEKVWEGVLPSGRYIFSVGETSQGADIHYAVSAVNGTTWLRNIVDMQGTDNQEFVLDYKDYDKIRVLIWIRTSVAINNKTCYPMIRLASDPDDTYQPYAMTNRELTEKKINITDLKTVVSASSDFADFKTRIASL